MQEKIALILKLRDDTDIIIHNLAYYYNIGIRDFYIMLHMPSKALLKIINSIINNLSDVKFNLLYHDKEGAGKNPINEEYLRVLTDRAQRDGFKWIIGTDADEFLILRKHKSIYDFILPYTHYETVSLIFKWANYYITEENSQNSKFYEKLRYRADYMGWTKSIGKFNQNMYFVQGLHHIADKNFGQVSSNLQQIKIDPCTAYYAHFPYRNKEQFVHKNKIQAQKFGGWRAKKLTENPLFFEGLWDKTIKLRIWPENLDKKELKLEKDFIFDPINPILMEIPE